MKDNNCIFCKLANGEIPTATIYEDEDFRVILDLGPATKGLDCDGYNIVQNNGEAAGQTVFHYHVHMIPRHKDDKVGLGWTMHELTEEEKEDVLSRI